MLDVDRSEFERGLLRQRGSLDRHAKRLTRGALESEDLVQECLTRALERSVHVSNARDPIAYVHTILRNVFRDSLKHGRRERALDDVDLERATAPNAPAEDRIAAQQVVAHARALPKAQADVLWLATVEERSYADIAAQLEIPVGTVMSRLSRARERLRLAL